MFMFMLAALRDPLASLVRADETTESVHDGPQRRHMKIKELAQIEEMSPRHCRTLKGP